ncbi:hypothetical protein H4582DRAFT_1970342 [Lactarius indigo]|nr:hypothetical protein H4582DRAFT_1970342 [Lactarius indigo]
MAATSCTGIIANPDLAGIGIRLNFYATVLLTVLIPPKRDTDEPRDGESMDGTSMDSKSMDRKPMNGKLMDGKPRDGEPRDELLDSLYLNAVFYGLALLITALVQTIQRQLDLYHAIVVMQVVLSLQFLHGFGMRRYILANKEKFRFKMKLTIAIQILSLLIFYPWSFYMWINAQRFGPQPECNDLVKFVLVFYTFQATVLWARYLCMTILAMTTFALLCYLIVIFIVYKVHIVQRGAQPSSNGETDAEMGNKPANKIKKLKKKMGKTLIRLLAIVAWVLSILSTIVCIANTELTVHRNSSIVQAGEGAWGFGQVVSVIFILPSVIEILAALDKRRK